ncbi:bifunctional folylpolyglutamate synthase/dihydrofolate synthase [Evansella cellulosilytica]|uniref:tetrahydrofolate synthase n=1 Tax=Evansella cellulosilytica (strain ATCC 21833 / DSM 2522 / FERM P-1141 / JCM 9156 / N-4) TaxID=649639 RepID=E6TZP5_EVAC2|nr:folylpolyglutamate synthase/dihydrofolate synthase family protein [Evansella cellulosilytica]ADU31351.1 FolC bifunctional protein [Evansella cellulosilytica DSM 2522]
MITTYKNAIDYVNSKRVAGIRYDLKRMEKLMEALNHPERKVKTIHVAGTNGKGSTVTFLRSMLQEAGFFVGTYMTPSFGDVREQIAINGEPMSESQFTTMISEIAPTVAVVEQEMDELISEFELITALALYYFSFKSPVDIAVIEAGMGGRNDATNVIFPLVSVITNVGYDHQEYLGDSLKEIAKEKAGIIKPGVAVMTACDSNIQFVFEEEAKEKRSSLYALQSRITYETSLEADTQTLSYEAAYRKLKHVPLKLLGDHQGKNAALALMTIDYLHQFYALMVTDEQAVAGLSKAQLAGRFEIIDTIPVIVLDTAHNPPAIEKTLETVKKRFREKEITVLFAAMKDKEIKTMIEQLEGATSKLFVTTFSSPRALPLSDFEQFGIHENQLVEHPKAWMKDYVINNESNIVLITGSHQFINDMKRSFH